MYRVVVHSVAYAHQLHTTPYTVSSWLCILWLLNNNSIHFRLSSNILSNHKLFVQSGKIYLESERSVFLENMMAWGRWCLWCTRPSCVADCLLYHRVVWLHALYVMLYVRCPGRCVRAWSLCMLYVICVCALWSVCTLYVTLLCQYTVLRVFTYVL